MPDKMNTVYPWRPLVAGLVIGIVLYQVAISLGGYTVISKADIEERQNELVALQEEINDLWDDFLSLPEQTEIDIEDQPYDETADARADVAVARTTAIADHEYLMITFGANWCVDCRTLYRRLKSPEVTAYTDNRFRFAHVNVGKFNRNNELAEELGVTLDRGIPVAIFFDPDGQVIGATNEAELEPARRYSSRQILLFLEDIAERGLITPPDSIHTAND